MRTRRATIVVGLVLAAALAGGIAYAAIPDVSGVINGCYRTSLDDQKGQLRVVDDPASCRSNETPIHWNQTGPRGDTGEQGIQGVQGIQGLKGEVGETGPQGLKGDTGDTGAAGTNGTNGTDGAPGAPGDPCLPTNPACVGPKGDTGDTGPQGPAAGGGNVFTKSTATIREWTGMASFTALSVSLPAGSYLVNARAAVENIGASGLTAPVDVIRCQLGSDIAGNVRKPLAGFQTDKWMLVSLVQLAAPGQLNLTCELDSGNPSDIWRVREAAIVALQTGAVTTQ
ncbi:MAG: hypothetical protein WD067_11595 [Gaiellaceae bacterium]